MNNLPQNVTSRYIRNLLVEGKNDDFELDRVVQMPSAPIGFHYRATIKVPKSDFAEQSAVGATPEQAIHRCLGAHGVTFR